MKNNVRLSEATFNPGQPTDPEERVVSVTDLNNDWKLDLLFQKPTGGPSRVWHMNGANLINSETLSPAPANAWRLVAP